MRLLLGITIVVAAVSSALAQQPITKYTSTARSKAISWHDDKDDPVGGFTASFRGLAGYDLELLGGDERSWINIKFKNTTVDLREETIQIGTATGSFPHKANDTVEWRGVMTKGKFVPYALIYRIAGVDENGRPKASRLIVVKLDGEHSRVIGFGEGAKAEAQAEALADRERPAR